MPTVTVPLGERSYPIHIFAGALRELEAETLPQEVVILTNETVAPLYGVHLRESLKAAGKRVLLFAAPEGERSKSSEWLLKAWDVLAEFNLSRRGVIIALGGGVVGDWAGFVAATWMRGVHLVQVPTTLLAMVDSSVGGKTGINHPRAKNLIGAFHQPQSVWIDPEVLGSLPPRELKAGLAEVVKYGVIADAEFFGWLEANIEAALQLDARVLEHIITRSCELKAQVVGEDERESDSVGTRAHLNYGHTAGHAIEATTAYGSYLHGEAISIGMTIAARLAGQMGICEGADELLNRQSGLFERIGLPTQVPETCKFDELWNAMTLDKKARAGAVNFILPTRLGQVDLFQAVPATMVRAAVEASR